MFQKVVKALRRFLPPGHRRKRIAVPEPPVAGSDLAATPLSSSLAVNLEAIQNLLGRPDDLVAREFLIAHRYPAAVLGIDGLIDRNEVHARVIRPLMVDAWATELLSQLTPTTLMSGLFERIIPVAESEKPARNLEEAADALLAGYLVLFVDGQDEALRLDLRQWEKRAVEEPVTESVIRGPRESFIENLRTNTAQIRRKIKSPNLRIETFTVGRVTQTKLALVYLAGTANEEIVEEARRRIRRIDLDGVLESGYIEEYLEDSPFSPFPQISATERPDAAAAALLEGRLAVFTDGTPFVLILPAVFVDFLASPEDYYQKVETVILVRMVRTAAVFFTLTLPSVYVALVTFHPEMIPTSLALSIAAGREGTPFPAILEALLMQILFEVLREAGVRLPRQLGTAISIVGALVIGQAAVTAGIVSPIMIIVIAVTGIGSFVIPHPPMVLVLRVLSFPILILAGLFGFVGLTFSLTLLLAHLASLRSFGVPYLSPYAPTVVPDLKDSLTRLHWWWMDTRPWYIAQRNLRRQARGTKPRPPQKATGGPQNPAVWREEK